jgi:hypothetical protein
MFCDIDTSCQYYNNKFSILIVDQNKIVCFSMASVFSTSLIFVSNVRESAIQRSTMRCFSKLWLNREKPALNLPSTKQINKLTQCHCYKINFPVSLTAGQNKLECLYLNFFEGSIFVCNDRRVLHMGRL